MIDNDHPWTTPQDYIDEARKRNRRGFFVGIDELEMFQGHIAEAEARAARLRGGITELRAELRRYYTGPGEADERIAELLMELDPGDLPDAAGKGEA